MKLQGILYFYRPILQSKICKVIFSSYSNIHFWHNKVVRIKNGKKPTRVSLYQRWLDKRIYKTEMKFWAVLGREKNLPFAISMQLLEVVFFIFS